MLNAVVVLSAISQVRKSMPGTAGSRFVCGRAIGIFVPGHADVGGDAGDGPMDGAGPEESHLNISLIFILSK